MAVVYLSPIGNSVIPFLNANGAPNANGFLSTYLAGTSTPSATYTTSAGTVNNAVAIPLGADGRVPNEIWLVSGTSYRFALTDSTGALIPGSTYDNINGINDPATFAATALAVASLTVSGTTTLTGNLIGSTETLTGALTGTSATFSGAVGTGALTSGALLSTTGAFSGALTPQALLNISGAAAGQIKFPATQNPSADVNTLDDYKEGTWTPSLGGTTTYTTQSGSYTKIGRMVFFFGTIVVNAIGTGSTGVISGLPFAGIAGEFNIFPVEAVLSVTNIVSIVGQQSSGGTQITLVSRVAASASDTGNAIFQNGTAVNISGCYRTT